MHNSTFEIDSNTNAKQKVQYTYTSMESHLNLGLERVRTESVAVACWLASRPTTGLVIRRSLVIADRIMTEVSLATKLSMTRQRGYNRTLTNMPQQILDVGLILRYLGMYKTIQYFRLDWWYVFELWFSQIHRHGEIMQTLYRIHHLHDS